MVRTETPLPASANREFSLPRLCRPSRIKPEGEPWAGACSLGQDIAGPGQRKPFDPPACHRSVRSGLHCEAQPRKASTLLETRTGSLKPFRRPGKGPGAGSSDPELWMRGTFFKGRARPGRPAAPPRTAASCPSIVPGDPGALPGSPRAMGRPGRAALPYEIVSRTVRPSASAARLRVSRAASASRWRFHIAA